MFISDSKMLRSSHDLDVEKQKVEATLKYQPSLDGLRAVCVIAVLLYHAHLDWIPGGFMGVEVFFVVSGYLITSLVLVEWTSTGTVSLYGFWMRRARRLLPAIYLLCFVCAVWALLFKPGWVYQIRVDIMPVLLYYANWHYIFKNQSYFMQDQVSIFRHLWSLSIEEQFYCLSPVLLLLALKRLGAHQWAIGIICISGGFLSLAMMRLLYDEEDPSRVYYGLDSRSSGLLFGAALAFVPPAWYDLVPTKVLKYAGLLWLAALLVVFATIPDQAPSTYQMGFGVVDLLSVGVIMSSKSNTSAVGKLLSLWPLPSIGRLSYGIYLWLVWNWLCSF
eukprot:TRINITY_DN4262_c0_g2_i1.p1 TRINITY_DN4262_c0_g2~~TRINITY_DN4262_c0_g2_i1.p1  ORF type:complete len:333 (+),score=-32.41 TRINITY_DN4262_c0_g2_i1:106-1104(+)